MSTMMSTDEYTIQNDNKIIIWLLLVCFVILFLIKICIYMMNCEV